MKVKRSIIIRKTDPRYAYLFQSKIPHLVDSSTHKDNKHLGNHTVTYIELKAPTEIAGLYMTNDYEGLLNNIDTLYSVNEE
jgi:hypothetical protein